MNKDLTFELSAFRHNESPTPGQFCLGECNGYPLARPSLRADTGLQETITAKEKTMNQDLTLESSARPCERLVIPPNPSFDAPRPCAVSRFDLRTLSLASLSDADEREMTALATVICPGSATYLTSRLRTYGHAIAADDDQGLAAFELIDEFEENGERFVYLGPLFSRDGACVPLFCHFVQVLLQTPQPFHLLTEAQNPEVVLLFKTLFPSTSYPALGPEVTPLRIRETAATFARRLDHIHGLDAANLSTRSGQTLFRRKPGCEAVLRWLEDRGVFLERGNSQMLVVSCSSAAERAEAQEDFRNGQRRLREWPQWRPRMLPRFERIACHA